jgi:hypothetical protein
MISPTWLSHVLAVVMAATALYCAGRVAVARVASRAIEVDADFFHVAMGLAMAAMLLGLSSIALTLALEVVFGLGLLWFCQRVMTAMLEPRGRFFHVGHQVEHALNCLVMLLMYMYRFSTVSRASMHGMVMSGPMGARYSTMSLLFGVLLLGLGLAYVGFLVVARPQPVRSSALRLTPMAFVSGTTLNHSQVVEDGNGRVLSFLAPRGALAVETIMCFSMALMLLAVA